MTKIEFLAASWRGSFVMLNNEPFKIYGIDESSVKLVSQNDFIRKSIEQVTPIIRHLDTLTQKCVQADYNDGKPFIPIVELAKIAFPQYCIKFEDGRVWVDTDWDIMAFSFNGKDFSCDNDRVSNQLQLFQQLLRWHFSLITDGSEVVYVTEEFNPYK